MRHLRPAQLDIYHHIVDALAKYGAAGVWAGMGLGKTGATYCALHALSYCEDVYPTLVIGPLRVAKNTWPDEITKWDLPTRVVSITGTAQERLGALARPADVYTINYENIPWLCKHFEKGGWPFKVVVIDESTKVAGLRVTIQTSVGGKPCKPFVTGQGTQRAKLLLEMCWRHRTKVIELTGTPATKGLEKLWGQLFFLDYGQRLGRTFSAFENRYFGYQKTADGFTKRWPLAHADKQIHAAVIDVCRSFAAKDYYDIKEPFTMQVWVDLPPAARKHYRDME